MAAGLEHELRREVGVGHPLHGVPFAAIGITGSDDVLVHLLDGSDRVAVVHLTWAQSIPEPLPWPMTDIYRSLAKWAEEGMRSDHEDYRN